MPPIKVMQLVARINIGGAARYIILLTSALDKDAFEQQLICGTISETEGDMAYLAREYGVEPQYIPQLGREISPLRDLRTLFKLYQLMRAEKPDIVHTHTAKAGFLGRIAAWLAGVPVRVHTFHGHVFEGFFSPAKSRIFIWLERLVARVSTRIITISPRLADELVDVYHITRRDKMVVIPLMLDLQPLVQPPAPDTLDQLRTSYDIPGDKHIVGITSRLVPTKNHLLFLKAAEQVLKTRDDVHFIIVGDGETRPMLVDYVAQHGLDEHVTFIGWVEDMRDVLYLFDVHALTSDTEGTPVVIMEALAAGIPVVATDVGGVSDVLDNGQYGRIVPPGDAATFAQTLISVLDGDHPDTDAARDMVLQRYDKVAGAQNMAAHYQQWLSEH